MNGRLQCHHSQVDKLYYPHISLIPISPYPLFLHYLNGYKMRIAASTENIVDFLKKLVYHIQHDERPNLTSKYLN